MSRSKIRILGRLLSLLLMLCLVVPAEGCLLQTSETSGAAYAGTSGSSIGSDRYCLAKAKPADQYHIMMAGSAKTEKVEVTGTQESEASKTNQGEVTGTQESEASQTNQEDAAKSDNTSQTNQKKSPRPEKKRVKPRWKKHGSSAKYYDEYGKVVTGKKVIQGTIYVFDKKGKILSAKTPVKKVIRQKKSIFGRKGCGPASALMALKAAGYQKNTSNKVFWKSRPKGISKKRGTGNPPLLKWLKKKSKGHAFRQAKRSTAKLRKQIMKGRVAQVLIRNSRRNHWITVYGYDRRTKKFNIADPWTGKRKKMSEKKLKKKMLDANIVGKANW